MRRHFDGRAAASRVINDGRHKLIRYPAGNRVQLFDLDEDPAEMNDLAGQPDRRELRARLEAVLIEHLYGEDLDWVVDGRLKGFAAPEFHMKPNRDLSGQRGLHFPQVPPTDPAKTVGSG
jgi:arylsulfatase